MVMPILALVAGVLILVGNSIEPEPVKFLGRIHVTPPSEDITIVNEYRRADLRSRDTVTLRGADVLDQQFAGYVLGVYGKCGSSPAGSN